jgi:Tfp pilus assembly protein PilN
MRKIPPFAKNNPEPPHSDHRKQTFQQILLPLVFFSLLMVAMVVLAGLTTRTSAADGASLASIALIFMLIPMLLVVDRKSVV